MVEVPLLAVDILDGQLEHWEFFIITQITLHQPNH
jgi:hypothetical protein